MSVTDSANRELTTVTTDVLNVVIDPFGGDIVEVKLLQHLTKMAEDGGQPITLLQRTSRAEYVALSGLIGGNATDKSSLIDLYLNLLPTNTVCLKMRTA